MNLDEFIFPASMASPAGISPSPTAGASTSDDLFTFGRPPSISAIQIKPPQPRQHQDDFSIAASAPSHQGPGPQRIPHDFSYVQRHVRKTSIDERRVSFLISYPISTDFSLTSISSPAPQEKSRCFASSSSRQQFDHEIRRSCRRSRPSRLFSRANSHRPSAHCKHPVQPRHFRPRQRSHPELGWSDAHEFRLFSRGIAFVHQQLLLHSALSSSAVFDDAFSAHIGVSITRRFDLSVHRIHTPTRV